MLQRLKRPFAALAGIPSNITIFPRLNVNFAKRFHGIIIGRYIMKMSARQSFPIEDVRYKFYDFDISILFAVNFR